MYVNGKNVETVPGIGEKGIKRKMEGMNSSTIYCKNFCKCRNNNKKILKRSTCEGP
jgi:hypothetical protein